MSINTKPLTVEVIFTASNVSLLVHAFLDSGSAGNFISEFLCCQLNLKKSSIKTHYQVQSIIGKHLNKRNVRNAVGPIQLQVGLLHIECIVFLVLENSTAGIILGRSWLVQHDPVLSWNTGEILEWGNSCFPGCFTNLPHPVKPISTYIDYRALNRRTVKFRYPLPPIPAA